MAKNEINPAIRYDFITPSVKRTAWAKLKELNARQNTLSAKHIPISTTLEMLVGEFWAELEQLASDD
jgi:hypothetical protein